MKNFIIPARKIVVVCLGAGVAFILFVAPFLNITADEISKMALTGALAILSSYIGSGATKDAQKNINIKETEKNEMKEGKENE